MFPKEDARANAVSLFPSSGMELVNMIVLRPLPQNWILVRRVLMASS